MQMVWLWQVKCVKYSLKFDVQGKNKISRRQRELKRTPGVFVALCSCVAGAETGTRRAPGEHKLNKLLCEAVAWYRDR